MFLKNDFKQIITIAIPLILSLMIQPIVGLINTKMMGFKDDPLWLASLSIAASTYTQMIWFFSFLFIGTLSLTSIAIGQKNDQEVKSIFFRNALIAIVLSILIISFHHVIFQFIFRIISPETQLQPSMLQYLNLRIYFFFIPLLNYVTSAWLIAHGKTVYILIYDLIFALSTLIFNIFFVVILNQNIRGIAIGTMAAEVISFLILLLIIHQKTSLFQTHYFKIAKHIFNKSRILDILRMNINLFIRILCLIGVFMLFNRYSVHFADNHIIAANAIILQILLILTTMLEAFGEASSSLIGQALGKKETDRIPHIVQAAFILSCGLGLLLSILIYFGAPYIIALLTNIDKVEEIILTYRIWFLILPIPMIIAFIFDGIMLGLKRIEYLRNASLLALLAFITSIFFIKDSMGINYLWISFLISFIARALYLTIMFFQIKTNRSYSWIIK